MKRRITRLKRQIKKSETSTRVIFSCLAVAEIAGLLKILYGWGWLVGTAMFILNILMLAAIAAVTPLLKEYIEKDFEYDLWRAQTILRPCARYAMRIVKSAEKKILTQWKSALAYYHGYKIRNANNTPATIR